VAELAPELFNGRIPPADAVVELPLQKIVAQIGDFPRRPDQVDEVYPPLDARYAKLAVEKDAAPHAAAPLERAPEQAPAGAAPDPIEPPSVETSVNGSTGNHAETPAAAETVSYSLAAIFPNVPESWLDGKLKTVDQSARITVPFELVEVQLASGRIELPFKEFFQTLPEDLKGHFSGGGKDDGAQKVVIPLSEVFQNLPGVEPLPPLSKPEPAVPEDVLLETVEIPEQEAEIAAETTPAEPAAIEANKSEPITAEVQEALLEEIIPAEAEAVSLQSAPEPAAVPEEPAISDVPEPTAVEAVETVAKPEAAAVATAEPAPAEMPAPETPVAEAAPEPAASVEPPHAAGPPEKEVFLPGIQIRPIAPPPLLPIEPVITAPERAQAENVEAKAPAPVQPVAHIEPETAAKTTAGNFIVTDGKLDTKKTVEVLALLPGITAAALTIKGKTRSAGGIPENFHPYETGKALFHSMESHTPQSSAIIPAPCSITVHHDQFSSTYFKQGAVMLCVVHPQRSLEAETHDAVLLVAREIVRLRQN
jgi:hypothetical protein